MAERTKYAPGTFSWTDLTTTDQDAAKQFYSQLFGWTAIDNPIGEDMVYSMMQIDGKDVAAISPPAPAAARRRRAAGVELLRHRRERGRGRRQCPEAGRHRPCAGLRRDGRRAHGGHPGPAGRLLHGVGAQAHIGASLVNVPGALAWNELASTDPDASAGFYRELFGWKIEPFEGMEGYLGIQTSEGRTATAASAPATENEPSYWLVYFGAEDADAGAAKATELGATTLVQMDIGVGKIAVLQDPQGAVFALFAGRFDD